MRSSTPAGSSTPLREEMGLDMAPLVLEVRRLLSLWDSSGVRQRVFRVIGKDDDLRQRPIVKKRAPELVLAGDVAVELGPPSLPSRALLITTEQDSLIESGRVTLVGPDLQEVPVGTQLPFAQVVMIGTRSNSRPDPFAIENAQYLMHRLPGYMARSIPGRLWIRVGRAAYESGLSFSAIGRALLATYLSEFSEVNAAEVVFVTGGKQNVEQLAPVALEAEIISGRHRKLALSETGDLECADLLCDTCEEKPVCDGLRDMLKHRS